MNTLNLDPSTRMSLLVRLRNPRDEEAWGEFTAIYEPVVYRMATRRGMQDADAREVVQDVLMSVSTAIDRFETDHSGSFRGWLSRITRNATIDRFRKLSTLPETVGASQLHRKLDELADQPSLLEEFDRDHRMQLFLWAAAQIRQKTGEKNWTAFWRTTVEDFPISQVAQELKVAEGTIYVARCRILKRIRELVDERLAE